MAGCRGLARARDLDAGESRQPTLHGNAGAESIDKTAVHACTLNTNVSGEPRNDGSRVCQPTLARVGFPNVRVA